MSIDGNDKPIMISKREAARMLGVCERTLHGWVKARTVPFKKVGRRVLFPLEKLRVWANDTDELALKPAALPGRS